MFWGGERERGRRGGNQENTCWDPPFQSVFQNPVGREWRGGGSQFFRGCACDVTWCNMWCNIHPISDFLCNPLWRPSLNLFTSSLMIFFLSDLFKVIFRLYWINILFFSCPSALCVFCHIIFGIWSRRSASLLSCQLLVTHCHAVGRWTNRSGTRL